MIFKFHSYNENIQQAKSILSKLNIKETNPKYKRIKSMLEGLDGYVGLFTKLHFIDKVSFNELAQLKNIIVSSPNTIRNLPKNLVEYDNYEDIIDDIEKAETKSDAKKMYNELPSKQKSFISINNEDDLNLLYLLSQRKDNLNFIKKISAFHDRDSLIRRLKSFLNSDSNADFDKIISTIKNIDAEIIHSSKDDDLIICRITQYRQCSNLGADTSWCIARSEGTFKSYVPNDVAFQYVIYFTDMDASDSNRKIGATFNITGFRTSHDVRDGYIDYNKLKNLLKDHNYDINNLKVKKENIKDIDGIEIKDLLGIGFTFEEIIERKKRYKSKDLELIPNNLIDKYDLINKTEIEGKILTKYTYSEIIDKNMLNLVIDDTLHIDDIAHIPPRIIKENMELILKKLDGSRGYGNDKDSDKDIFKEHFTKNKSELDSAYDYRVGSQWSDNNKYSLDKTIQKLRYYMVGPYDFDLNELSSAFYNIGKSDFKKILEFLKGSGYKFTNEEIINFFDKIRYVSSFDTKVSFYDELLSLGINCKKQFLEFVKSKSWKWESWDLESIKKAFSEKELEQVSEKQKKATFIDDLAKCAILASHSLRKTEKSITPNDFYKKWNSYIQITEIPYGRDGDLWVALIFIYASLSKLDELNNIQFDFSNRDFVNSLAKAICGMWFYNSRIWIGLELENEQKKNIYKWISKSHMTQILYDLKDHEGRLSDYQLQVMYYLFDKPAFKDYLEECSNVTNNDYRHGRNDKKIFYTIKIKNLTAIFNYLMKKEMYSDIKKIIAEILKWKMSNDERQQTFEWLYHKLGGDSNYTSDIKIYNDNFKNLIAKSFPGAVMPRKARNDW